MKFLFLLFSFYQLSICFPVNRVKEETAETAIVQHTRQLTPASATYLLIPLAVIIGTEGAILGATGVSFGDGVQFVGDEFASVGNGIKVVGDEIKIAGETIQSLSRGLKGLSGVIFEWGTGQPIPVIGNDGDVIDSLTLLSKLPTNISKPIFDFYSKQSDAELDDDEP